MKNIYKFGFAVAVVLLMFSSCKPKAAAPSFSDEAIPVHIISLKSLQTPSEMSATGLVSTADQANYGFKIGGIISKVFVQEGASFKKGQLLAILNPAEISSGLDQSRLSVEKAKRDYSRALNLYKDSVATLEQLQNAKTALDIAQKSQNVVAFNVAYSKIYAKADGFVVKKLANEGEVISSGTSVLAVNEMSGSTNWTVKIGVTDKEWSAIAVGQAAEIVLDPYPGKKFPGTVMRKSQAADPASGSFQVELQLLLKGNKTALGMFAKATIKTGAKQMLTPIPYQALVEADGNNAFIYIPKGTDRVARLPVVIGNFNNQQAFIMSGLEGVKSVIVSNSAFLNEKSIIKIVK